MRAIADTSLFLECAPASPLDSVPDEIAVSVMTAAELEVRILRAHDAQLRAQLLAMLSRLRGAFPLLALDEQTASHFAGIADAELRAGRRVRTHEAWIAATALQHGAAVLTRNPAFSEFDAVKVVRV